MKDLKSIKLYIVGGDLSYGRWLSNNIVYSIEEADLVIFTGGEDVSPILYEEPRHYSTYSHLDRDISELLEYKRARMLNKPMVGICRGSQFLFAMNGGKLFQDVDGHATGRLHSITTVEGDEFDITSTHHQMWDINSVINAKVPHNIIAWSSEKLASKYSTGNEDSLEAICEPEILYFPKTNCLCIQGHPEFENCPELTVEFCKRVINKYLL